MITQAELTERLNYDPETGVFTWLIGRRPGSTTGKPSKRGYARIMFDGRAIPAHRVAWVYVHGDTLPSDMYIDHIDRNPSNNKITNLRLATPSQNSFNTGSKPSRGIAKGVSFNRKKNRWSANCMIRGVAYYLGSFSSEQVASEAYRQFASAEHLEYYYEGLQPVTGIRFKQKGVYFLHGKWHARYTRRGVRHIVGEFDTSASAFAALVAHRGLTKCQP